MKEVNNMEAQVLTITAREQMKNIIKRYLKTMVYIDDKFDLSLVGGESEPVIEPPKRIFRKNGPTEEVDDAPVYTNPVSAIEKDRLSDLLEKMQRKYADIKLQPVKYTSKEDKNYVESSIKSSKLVVIDWELSDAIDDETHGKYTAADALKVHMESKDKMRLLVVYTSDIDGAENDFMAKGIIPRFDEDEINGKKYKYIVQNSSIIMLCKKMDFDAENLIEAYAELVIKKFGYFPVAFLDMLLKLDDKVGILLKKFSQPFDSILLMQLESSGTEYRDNTELLRDLVTNSVYDEIECDPCIVDNMYKERINTLIALGDLEDAQFDEKKNSAVNYMLSRCSSDSKKVYQAVKAIPASDFKAWLKEIDKDPENWNKSLNKFQKSIAKKAKEVFAESIYQDLLQQVEITPKDPSKRVNIDSLILKIKLNIIKSIKNQVEMTLMETTSVFLMLLSDMNIGVAINDLIANLKLKSYTDENEIAQIINNNITVNTQGEVDQCCKERMKNKLFSGDILFKEKDDGAYEFLICITPSCQMFRPHKVDYVVSYVKGEVFANGFPDMKRDSEHFSIIPHPSTADKLIGIKWKFHDTKQFDLKVEEDRNNLISYKRRYRLTDDYYRQMTSEFNAFYSKVGVEDLFIKSSKDIANFFL